MHQNDVYIIDGFIFFNEMELLKARVSILKDVVDCHLCVEGNQTFQGDMKPLNYIPISEKILYGTADLPTYATAWLREYYQRNVVVEYARNIQVPSNKLVILLLSDVDEVPHPDAVRKLRTTHYGEMAGGKIAALHTDTYYYYTNLLTSFGSYAIKAQKLDAVQSGQDLRSAWWDVDIYPAGWHFSYIGDIATKIKAFSHTELNTPAILESISENVENTRDLFGRDVHMEYIDKERIPKEVWHLARI